MSSNTESLPDDLLERVLKKLGFSDHPSTDLLGLQALYRAWCYKIPFDNIRKLIHLKNNDLRALPGNNPSDFFEDWLKYGTGGTCWSGNGALHALLVSLGFTAYRGIGTMLIAPNMPPNHGTVLVEYDRMLYLVDASILHNTPLKLDEHSQIDNPQNLSCIKLYNREKNWHVWWRPLHIPNGIECRIDYLQATQKEFHERYEQTRSWSPFNYQLYMRLNKNNSAVGIAMGQYVVLNDTNGVTVTSVTEHQRSNLLIEEFAISEELVRQLPPERPTPPPPWSETAPKTATK